MAHYQIISWKHIPSQVVAREGETQAKVMLSPRFQNAIDAYAMREGSSESEAYLEGWHRSEWQAREGSAEEVARTVAAELESSFSQIEMPPSE